MALKGGNITPLTGDDQAARQNRMDMWNESIRRAAQTRTSAQQAAKDENELRAEMEQKIRNGQIPCPECATRTYQDESDDPGVSFQAPGHIPAAIAKGVVMKHELEHVASEGAKAREEGKIAHSIVTIEKCTCETCGRTIIAGGTTSTRFIPEGIQRPPRFDGGFEAEA